MSPDDEAEIYEAMRAARLAARGYADFFGWATNRDLEEQGVVRSLTESLIAEEVLFFSKIKMRGRVNRSARLGSAGYGWKTHRNRSH
jgi:hypothetical protein